MDLIAEEISMKRQYLFDLNGKWGFVSAEGSMERLTE